MISVVCHRGFIDKRTCVCVCVSSVIKDHFYSLVFVRFVRVLMAEAINDEGCNQADLLGFTRHIQGEINRAAPRDVNYLCTEVMTNDR